MRIVLVLLVLSVFINYVDRGNLSIAAPLLKAEMGLSDSRLGILLSSFFWGYTVALFFCGWLVDRFDVNRVLAAGFFVWSLATAAAGLVHGFALLILMRVLLGVGESVAFPSYSKIFARFLPEHERGFANAAIIAGLKLGPAAGTLGAGLLMTRFGWRTVFVAIGLISLLWLPAWIKWRPHRAGAAPDAGRCPSAAEILRQRQFWANTVAAFCCAYPLYFTVTWLPLYLVRAQHLSMSETVRTATLYYVIDGGAALVTGWAADRSIRRGFSVTRVRKCAMVAGWVTAAAGFLGCAFAGSASFAWLVVTAVGMGMGNSGLWAVTQTLAGPRAVGRWAGLKNGCSNLAGVICPALTGFTVDWSGNFQVALGITAAVCLLGTLVWVVGVGEIRQVEWTRNPAVARSPVLRADLVS